MTKQTNKAFYVVRGPYCYGAGPTVEKAYAGARRYYPRSLMKPSERRPKPEHFEVFAIEGTRYLIDENFGGIMPEPNKILVKLGTVKEYRQYG